MKTPSQNVKKVIEAEELLRKIEGGAGTLSDYSNLDDSNYGPEHVDPPVQIYGASQIKN